MQPTQASRAARQGLIGPNALIRMAEAITALEGAPVTTRIFKAAGLEQALAQPPSDMVPGEQVAALHRAAHAALGDARARTAGWVAGQRTADYVLENRIPAALRAILPHLPTAISGRILCAMIARHAWTFAGSGKINIWRGSAGTLLTIAANPLCQGAHAAEPWCDFYAATFERLFARLVHPSTRVRETHCTAMGAPECVFEIAWPGWLRARPPAARIAANPEAVLF